MRPPPLPKDDPNKIFLWSQIRAIRAQCAAVPRKDRPATVTRLAEAYIVSRRTILDIAAGRTWIEPKRKRARA